MRRDKNENLRQFDFINLDQSSWSLKSKFILSILKTQYNLEKGFQATIGPIPGTRYSVRCNDMETAHVTMRVAWNLMWSLTNSIEVHGS